MTIETKHAPHRTALPALVFTALALAGCSTGHIGESWQCPLAEGGSCDSVAAADPAVPEAGATREAVLAGPLWRVRGGGTSDAPAETPCAAECDGGFDPFAWLARLFADTDADGRGAAAGEPAPATQDPAAEGAPASDGAVPAAGLAASPVAAGGSELPPDGPAPLPADAGPSAEPGPAQDDPTQDDPTQDDSREGDLPGADLRTGEVVARIWIAPFVDADGVYREASHVRVVLAPAGWRLK